MPTKLAVLRNARQDLKQAFHWYEGQQAGLGKRFLAAANACMAAIRRAPKAARLVQGPYRRANVSVFPYAIFYYYDRAEGYRRRACCHSHLAESGQMAAATPLTPWQSERRPEGGG